MEQLLLITVVAVAALTAVAGFVIGDRRRRADLGRSGPQPCRSVGDALTRAGQRYARVLILFLGKDAASVEGREALAADPEVLALLGRGDLVYVVVGEDREIAETLFTKYGRSDLPEGPAVVLLDRKGLLIATASGAEHGALGAWLPGWVAGQAQEGRGEPAGA